MQGDFLSDIKVSAEDWFHCTMENIKYIINMSILNLIYSLYAYYKNKRCKDYLVYSRPYWNYHPAQYLMNTVCLMWMLLASNTVPEREVHVLWKMHFFPPLCKSSTDSCRKKIKLIAHSYEIYISVGMNM